MDRPTARLTTLAVVVVLASACVTQQPPDRAALPDVAVAVAAPRPCSVVVGESLGVEVESVPSGSPSEGVIEAADRLVAVDGSPVSSLSDVRDALSDRAPGDDVAVDLGRAGASISDTVTLGSSADGLPRLGITISEVYDEVPVAEFETTPAGTGLARLVQVGDRLLSVDPGEPTIGVFDLTLPDTEFWQAIGGVAYWVDGPTTDDPTLRTSDGGVIEAWEDGVVPARILGTVGDDLVVVFLGPAGVSVRRIPTSGGEAEWISRPSSDLGLPVVTYASPDGSVLVLGLGTAESPDLRFLLMDADTGAIRVELEGLAGNSVFGWFDETGLATQGSDGVLVVTDVGDGSTRPIDLPTFGAADVRLWPVGDGVHVLVDTGSQLLRIDAEDEASTRPIIARCQIGAVGQPGSG